MRISKADLEEYRQALIDLGQESARYVIDEIGEVGGKGVSSVRDATISALQDSIGIYGDEAQALAGQLFDEVCAAEGISATSSLYDDLIDMDMVSGKVRWLCRKVVEGDTKGYVDKVGVIADFYTKRCNYMAQMRNCHGANMRYARIPTGQETCDWCLMLASRGFVYYTEGDAKAGNHQNCDCICVPGRGGGSFNDATQVEGYDPDEYYRMWRESGFMPPKYNPRLSDGSYRRVVYNQDITSAQGYANARRSAAKRLRRMSPTRGLRPQETETYYRRMNEATTDDDLKAEYRDIINDLIRRGNAVTDADWEDVANHYAYMIEERKRKRRR